MSSSDSDTPPIDSNFDLVLLANFVHQVVNPLNGVAGTIDNLAEGVIKETHKRDQRLRAARAQLEQCITLMRNLAFLAQGFTKLAEEERKIAVLPQVIIESAMFYQEDGKSRGVEISLSDRSTQNRVSGHPELLRQVLMNIFDNCIKYSAKDSVVTVEQRIQKKTSQAIITISNKSEHPIAVGDLEKLFELGFRGTNARKSVASGTGLGLYITKKIVEDVHGGSLHVQTGKNNELQFTIKLPGGAEPVS